MTWLRHRARRENRRDLHVAQGDRGLRRHRRPWRGNGQRLCSSVARRRAPAAERAGHPLACAGARTSRTSSRRRERAAGRVGAADPAERRRHRSIATAERLFTAARPRFRAGTRRIYRAPRPLRLAATASTSLRSAALNRMPHRSCIPRTHTRARRESPSASKISDLVRADSDQIDPSLRANGSGLKWSAR
jgi:hypothetical protein